MTKKVLPKCSSVEQVFETMLQQLGDHPVEFQLPDWLKKDKSMTYTIIKRNVYLTKKPKRRAEDDGIFCSCAPSSGQSAACDSDCLCGMLLSSCSRSCNCGDSCVNKPFQYRPAKKIKLIKTEKCGAGLVVEEDISQGDFVIEYVGEVIDDKTCEERLWKMRHCGETNFYLCEINRDMVIDATYKGNKSRFINHSCQPNTEMQKWFVQFGADQDCYCGAEACRQKLGNKPNKLKYSPSDAAFQLVLCEMATSSPNMRAFLHGKDDFPNGRADAGFSHLSASKKKTTSQNCIWEAVRVWCPQDRRYYGGIIVEFNCYSRKHTIVREDGQVKILDILKGDWDLLPL